MGAAVDDVEGRHGQHDVSVAGQVGNVAVQGHAPGSGPCFAHRQRHRQDGVGAQLLLQPPGYVPETPSRQTMWVWV